jgi:EmrB/QacA subfamily drug resistance transporter
MDYEHFMLVRAYAYCAMPRRIGAGRNGGAVVTAARANLAALPARQRRMAFALLCLAPFLAVLDTAVVAIALPSMERGLGFAAAGVQVEWVLNGYAMALGGLLLLGGRLADVLGPRRVFVAGLAVFGVASVAGGLAAAPWMLVAARIAQGVGAAAFEPAALAMVTLLFPEPAARNRALGVFGAMVGLGYLAGMVLGGALTEWLGWRAVLFINVPVALAAVLLALALLPDRRPAGAARTLDLPGAAAIITAVAALLIALAAVPRYGWLAWATLGPATVGIVLLALFVVIESRSSAPLLPLSVLRLRPVAIANSAALLKSCIGMAQLYVLTLYFQDVLGRSPLQAGLLFGPMAAVSVVAGAVAGRLATRLGLRAAALLGLVLLGSGLLALAGTLPGGVLWQILGLAAVAEVGFMIASVPLTIVATVSLPDDRRGLAAGLLGTTTQLGNAIGLGVVATVVAVSASLDASVTGLVTGLRTGLLASVGFVAVACMLSLIGLPNQIGRPQGAPTYQSSSLT